MIHCPYDSLMSCYNRFADSKPDSHALMRIAASVALHTAAVKQILKPFRRNPLAIIPHMESNAVFSFFHIQLYGFIGSGMIYSIFQKIHNQLLNQHGVHRNH